MHALLTHFLSGLELGDPQSFHNLTAFPLFGGNGTGPSYLTLAEALAKGLLTVKEVSEGGSVPQLIAVNAGDLPVLVLDGEELRGAKQNRSLNATLLLAARSATAIPVSCTEAGRWNYRSRTFDDSGEFVPQRVRASKFRSVSDSLEGGHGFTSNQGAVWAEIGTLSGGLGSASPTHAMRDAYELHRGRLGECERAFPLAAGQRGLLVAVDGAVVSLDWVSRPEAWAHLHARVVRSHALSALADEPGDRPAAVGVERAREFLFAAASGAVSERPSVALGTDLRVTGEGVLGAALAHEASVIHLYLLRGDGRRDDRPRGHRREPRPNSSPTAGRTGADIPNDMTTYDYDPYDNHIVADIDGDRFLVDTGAPVSLGSRPHVRVAGRTLSLVPSMMGLVTPAGVGQLMGTRLDGLLAMDLLGRVPFTIDPGHHTLAFGGRSPRGVGWPLRTEIEHGVPIVTVEIDGRPVRMVFDTGANHSFLAPALTTGRTPDPGEMRDFYPLIGHFTTPAFSLPLRLASEERLVQFGHLPPALDVLFRVFPRVQGLLGTDILRWGPLRCDFARGEMRLG